MVPQEDFVSWLTDMLALERQALTEQQHLQLAWVEERHRQLVAQLQVHLQDAPWNMRPSSDAVKHSEAVSETRGGAKRKLGIQISKPHMGCQILEQDAPPPPPTSAEPAPTMEVQAQSSLQMALESTRQSTELVKAVTDKNEKVYKTKSLQNLVASSDRVTKDDSLLVRLVHQPAFEVLSASMIAINTLILACEIEYFGFDSGHSVGYKQYAASTDTWPQAEAVFSGLDVFFVSIFTLELLLRIMADGLLESAKSLWIWFDAGIVIASLVSLLDTASGSEATLDPTLLRIARLVRMMRLLKMVRLVQAFDSLFLLLKSIRASVSALFWSFLLIITVEVAVGMCVSQAVREYIQDERHDFAKRMDVFLLYGTYTRTMVTMFEITLGNWVPSCRILMNNVSEWFGLFYILYCCCFMFAVIRVIQAVFIAETNRVVTNDDQISIIRKEREKASYLSKLHVMFEELDSSGDGHLSRDELTALRDDKLLQTLMSTLGINTNDLETLFDLLDDGDGQIEIHEFIKGLSRVKGGAQAIDVVSLLKLARRVDKKVDYVVQKFSSTAGGRRTNVR